jgi:hypothetical protein
VSDDLRGVVPNIHAVGRIEGYLPSAWGGGRQVTATRLLRLFQAVLRAEVYLRTFLGKAAGL